MYVIDYCIFYLYYTSIFLAKNRFSLEKVDSFTRKYDEYWCIEWQITIVAYALILSSSRNLLLICAC